MNGKPIGQTILAQFIHLLNHFLALDPDLHYLIKPLIGTTVHIDATDYRLSAQLQVYEDGFKLSFDTPAEAQLTLTGHLVDLLALCLSTDPKSLLAQKQVELKGSIKALMDLSRFCQQFSPDLEAALAKWLGNPMAHHTYQASKRSLGWLKKNIRLCRSDFIEYLQEELKLIPSMQEFNAFSEDVHSIQSDVDRFEARLKLLIHHEH